MTHEEILAALARAEAATEGPWRNRRIDNALDIVIESDNVHPVVRGFGMHQCDAEFMAHARTDVPALCVELLKYKAFVAWLRSVEADGYVDALWKEFEKKKDGT